MAKVVTWQSPNGLTLDITPEAEEILTAARCWPKTEGGDEYASVSRGLHTGEADIDADKARKIVAEARR